MSIRFVVAGAPCSGKSTYVRENSKRGDLVYDYDKIHQALSGQGSHVHLETIRPYVIAARDAVFSQLEAHGLQSAFVITSSPKRAAVEALASRLAADLVLLDVSFDEAHRRADLDERPEVWHSYIDNWFTNSDFGSLDEGEKMSQKSFIASMEFKEGGEPGEFIARFASLNVIDLDTDVTIPGAFVEGQAVIIEPWNHGWDLPAGKGVIHADEAKAWVDGAFFLDTEVGRENYRTVKNLGPLAEWSYTFRIEKSSRGEFEEQDVQFLEKLDTIGVSPVTRGAGINTETESIKSEDGDDPASAEAEGETDGKPSGDLLALIDAAEINIITIGVENG